MSVIPDENYCLFYRFWAWEYCKRNKTFIRVLKDRFLSPRYYTGKSKETLTKKLEDFGYYGFIDFTTTLHFKSDDLLLKIINGDTFSKPNTPRWVSDGIQTLEYRGPDDDFESMYGVRLARQSGLSIIDFSMPLEALIEQLKFEYLVYHGVASSVSGLRWVGPQSNEYKRERLCISSRKNVSFEIDNRPRSIGLWLWDYIEKEVGNHPPGGQWLAKAIKTLKENFDIARIGYADSEKETFRKLYRRTNACIAAAEVLSLK